MTPPALHRGPRRAGSAFALCALLMVFAAQAAEMYRWVDEKGVTNVSDSVPDKYKAVAQRVDTTQLDADEARRRAAARPSAAPASGAASSAGLAGKVAPPASAVPGAASLSASGSALADGDCPSLQRRFREAQKCFGPAIKTLNGNVNSARSPECPSVVDPEPKCGPDPLLK
jgi:hypothetical protein